MRRPPRPAWQLRVGMLVGGFRVHVWAMRPGCARVTQRISMPPLQVLSCSSADHLPPWMRGPFEARLCLRHASASQGSMATRSWHAAGWPSGSCVGFNLCRPSPLYVATELGHPTLMYTLSGLNKSMNTYNIICHGSHTNCPSTRSHCRCLADTHSHRNTECSTPDGMLIKGLWVVTCVPH